MAATSAPSSSLCNRLHNLYVTPSSFSITLKFTPSPIFHKPPNLSLNLKSHALNPSPLSLYHLRLASAAFDGFEVAQDSSSDEQVVEPEAEPSEQEKDEDGQKVSESDEAGRLYVGNLPFSMTSSELSEVFQEAGNVLSVEIVYNRVTGRSRGFAFVTMASVEDAKEAIRMFDGAQQVGGRTVKVNFPEVPRGGERRVMWQKNLKAFVDSPYKIYAGNLAWGLTNDDLRNAFASQPGFVSAMVVHDRDTGRSRGFGFVSFETAEHVEAALSAMNGVEVKGRALRLNLATPTKTSGSPPTMDETTQEDSVDSSELVSSMRAHEIFLPLTALQKTTPLSD